MRHPSEIAGELRRLEGQTHDGGRRERVADLLVELVEGLAPSREQAPPTWAAVRQALASVAKIRMEP